MKNLYWTDLGDGVKEIRTKDGKITAAYSDGIYLVDDGKESFYTNKIYLDKRRAVVRAKYGESWKEYLI